MTPKGKYEFLTMPFGLVLPPSTFQRLMDEVLDGIQEHTLAYLDDIKIHNENWEDHLAHLEEVFSRLRKAGLTIKEKKCTFASGSCDYLDYVVGSGTVRPISAMVAAIKDYAAPQTKKDVRTFLGHCGYYRKFIADFATVATPLSNLTRKGEPNKVNWTDKCEVAFKQMKVSVMQAHILVILDWSLPFVLQTVASATGLGYVLSQINSKGEEHPIAYASKKCYKVRRTTHP